MGSIRGQRRNVIFAWKVLLFMGNTTFFARSGPSSLISNRCFGRSISLKSRIIGPFPQDSGLLCVVSAPEL